MKQNYKCVMCNGYLQLKEQHTLICGTCSRQYPIINGIAVLIARHNPALLSIGRYIESQQTQFDSLKSSLSKLGHINHSNIQVDKMLQGMQGNLHLMQQNCKPVLDYLRSQQIELGNIDWFFSMDPGRSYHYMLRYFYQDWYGGKDFSQVKNLVIEAVSTYCDDNESVAVLGCGACGLLYHLAERFSVSYGLDLAIPTLMTAQQLLRGEDITVYLEAAEWKEIHIKAPEKATNQINLVAGNIMHLPFGDSSLSVIVTQYMMDLECNHPHYLTNEINRVLKPGGIWINFSLPFRVPGDVFELGPVKALKLPAFFEKLGFELLCNEQQRFKLWNFEAVTDEGNRVDHQIQFYVARKNSSSKDQKLYMSFFDYFAHQNDELWARIPKTIDERTLSVIKKSEFRESGIHNSQELQITFTKECFQSFPVESEYVDLIETIFKLINGKRSLHDIYNFILEDEIKLTKDEFIEFFHALLIYYYLVVFKEIEND